MFLVSTVAFGGNDSSFTIDFRTPTVEEECIHPKKIN